MDVTARPRLVMLRALGLGDFLAGVPAYRALRAAYPEHETVLAAPAALAPLAALTGAVDRLLPTGELEPVAWPGAPPDVAVDLHGNGPASHRVVERLGARTTMMYASAQAPDVHGPRWDDGEHEVTRWCRLLEWYGVPADPADLRLADPDRVRPCRFTDPPLHWAGYDLGAVRTDGALPEAVDDCGYPTGGGLCGTCVEGVHDAGRVRRRRTAGAVVLHPGAAFGSRRWPADRFAAVARALARDGHRVVITGVAAERELGHRVAAGAGLPPETVLDTDLLDLAALVADATLVISNDTGTAHLATAYGTPSVTLFGPVSPALWGPPHDPRHVAIWHGSGDRPGDAHGDTPDPRLLTITVEEVLTVVKAVTAGPARLTPPSGTPRTR